MTILLSLGMFGYGCDQDRCLRQSRNMNIVRQFCYSEEGIKHIDDMYSAFLKKKSLNIQSKLGITIEEEAIVKKEESKPTIKFEQSKGDIKCYLQDRNMYHSDEWIGTVEYNNNMFTYYSKFKEEKITVSGPCVVREEKE